MGCTKRLFKEATQTVLESSVKIVNVVGMLQARYDINQNFDEECFRLQGISKELADSWDHMIFMSPVCTADPCEDCDLSNEEEEG